MNRTEQAVETLIARVYAEQQYLKNYFVFGFKWKKDWDQNWC